MILFTSDSEKHQSITAILFMEVALFKEIVDGVPNKVQR